jgi:hypothetical protein
MLARLTDERTATPQWICFRSVAVVLIGVMKISTLPSGRRYYQIQPYQSTRHRNRIKANWSEQSLNDGIATPAWIPVVVGVSLTALITSLSFKIVLADHLEDGNFLLAKKGMT